MTRSILVTGSAGGIGADIAGAAAAAGYRVALLDVSNAVLDTAAGIPGATGFVGSTTDVDRVAAVLDEFGTPDAVVNNAGIVRFGPLLDQTLDNWRAVVDVNLTGTFVVAQAVARRLVAEGRTGAMVNITSMNGVMPGPNAGAYGSTKSAVALLTKQMAVEWGPHGIRVNAIAPGLIDAGMSGPIYADPQVRANQNLVRQIGDYRSRLETLAREKSELETKLEKSQQTLSSAQDGAPVVLKHDFDLAAADWKEFAKDGTIKYQNPCMDLKGWTPSPEKLSKLGLAPEDGATINASYKRSSERLWATVKPLCAAAIGSADVAARIGPDTCISLILDTENARDREGTDAARRMVGEIRSGARPMPGPNEPLNPIAKLFLAMTGSTKALEDDLGQSFGPDEAHRLAYSDQLCMGRHTYGGSAPKK